MRIIVIDGAKMTGVGGALRGREMALALRSLGHDIALRNAVNVVEHDLSGPRPPEAVILTGTWHQLLGGGDRALLALNAACESRGVPCLWWYGSNGSVWGSVHPDSAIRAAEKQKIINLIQARPFIGVICPYSRDIYEREGVARNKMRLIPSVFDADLFTPEQDDRDRHVSDRLRFDYQIPPGAFVLGTVGHCPSSKGSDDILRAMALLRDEMPDLFYLVQHTPLHNLNRVRAKSPDGKREGKSEHDVVMDSLELAKTLGLSDRIRFLGMRRPRDSMPAFYRLLNAYCSPSKAENLGQPLVESQLCGLPLVTFKGFSFDFVACPFSAQQILAEHTETDDYGLVIPFANPADLVCAIRGAREKAESAEARAATREWTTQRFGHQNAQTMVDALVAYRRMIV